jgi:hypothetical protein
VPIAFRRHRLLSISNLPRGFSKLSETFAKKDRTEMSANAASILREEAKFRWPTLEYHQDRIWRLQDWLKWGHRRVRSIYNSEDGVALRDIEVLRLQEIKAAQDARKAEARDAVRKSQANYRTLEARIAALEALFEAVDPEFGSEHLAALRSQSRGQGQGAA